MELGYWPRESTVKTRDKLDHMCYERDGPLWRGEGKSWNISSSL